MRHPKYSKAADHLKISDHKPDPLYTYQTPLMGEFLKPAHNVVPLPHLHVCLYFPASSTRNCTPDYIQCMKTTHQGAEHFLQPEPRLPIPHMVLHLLLVAVCWHRATQVPLPQFLY